MTVVKGYVRPWEARKRSVPTTHLGIPREVQQRRHTEAMQLSCFLFVVDHASAFGQREEGSLHKPNKLAARRRCQRHRIAQKKNQWKAFPICQAPCWALSVVPRNSRRDMFSFLVSYRFHLTVLLVFSFCSWDSKIQSGWGTVCASACLVKHEAWGPSEASWWNASQCFRIHGLAMKPGCPRRGPPGPWTGQLCDSFQRSMACDIPKHAPGFCQSRGLAFFRSPLSPWLRKLSLCPDMSGAKATLPNKFSASPHAKLYELLEDLGHREDPLISLSLPALSFPLSPDPL